ncbi:MAG: hypothetical protein HZA08_06165 [Nitrospirae bacterium]|nr:hypothetical protein [Nitrospirota bacterium]
MAQKQYLRIISDDSRIRIDFTVKKGKVEKFVTQYELLINKQWNPIIRYDTVHNFVHIDIINPDGTKIKKELNFLNYNEALTFSILDLNTNWKNYKKGFLRRLKNEKR